MKFMIDQNFNNINLEHYKDTKGVYLLQSFIKNTEAGMNPIGFEHIENGSWFAAYKVENEDVWDLIRSGKFNGFSVEGFFELEEPTQPNEIRRPYRRIVIRIKILYKNEKINCGN